MSKMVISVGELRRIINEEKQDEMKPVVFGDKESKKINQQAYSDIKKETEKYNGGLTKEKKQLGGGIEATDNQGMHDLRYDSINKPFIDRTEAQLKGYVSKDAENMHKNDEFGNATFDNNGNIQKAAKKHAEAMKQGKDTAAEIGLTSSNLKKDDIEKNTKTMHENKIKMLSFKNTQFISEGHMMSKIPDEYKKEGSRFIMKDSAKNEYLVEWSDKPKVTKKLNMALVNEQKERIKSLWEYKSPESNISTSSFRIKEDKNFSEMVNKARHLMN
jgi:hypothetical protein